MLRAYLLIFVEYLCNHVAPKLEQKFSKIITYFNEILTIVNYKNCLDALPSRT